MMNMQGQRQGGRTGKKRERGTLCDTMCALEQKLNNSRTLHTLMAGTA